MAAARLFSTSSAEAQWQAVAKPWMSERAQTVWEDERPTVILTPSRAEGFYLRSRFLGEGNGFLGLQFWTPSDLRTRLAAAFAPLPTAATLAEQRLLARACAEKLAAEDPGNASLQSVVRDPAAFLRAHDLLSGAGWDPARDGAPYGRDLARRFQAELAALDATTQPGLHRALADRVAARNSPRLAHLLIFGFNAAHWPLWDLLRAAVLAADHCVVLLSEPAVFGADIDQLWISSWEEFVRAEKRVVEPTDNVPAPFVALAASYEAGTRERDSSAHLTFCVTSDLTSQVRAVVLRALDFLGQKDCTRLGIVFPQGNALALGVSAELHRLEVSLDDGPGVITPGIFECRSWQTWLALQEEPGAARLIAWLRACAADGVRSADEEGLSVDQLASRIGSAISQTLIDDLDFLSRHLEASAGRYGELDAAAFLRKRIALPNEAILAEYQQLTRRVLALPGWEALADALPEIPSWLAEITAPISRRSYLEWLREATASQTRTRGNGNQFYGRVHLILAGQLASQTWSHLILTGLNEGVWPRLSEAGAFGSRQEMNALNRQARTLNRRVRREGSQGEGQEVVRAGFGHALLPMERHDLALRDLCTALESTTHAVCLAAVANEGGSGRLPSDFLVHAYQFATGQMLDENLFRALAETNDAWVRRHADLLPGAPHAPKELLRPTLIAHEARRDSHLTFGPFEFAYAHPPENPVQLACKQWERSWNHPESVWIEHIAGVRVWPDGTLSWQGTVGTWVHEWLALALRECRDGQTPAAIIQHVRDAAGRTQRRIHEQSEAVGFEPYAWWDQVLMQARTVAISLAENIAPFLEAQNFVEEYQIPRDTFIALPGSKQTDFKLTGRLDLLLLDPGAVIPPGAESFSPGSGAWVIDFKTRAIRGRDQAKIDHRLQPLLYALALWHRGAEPVAFSLLTPGATLKKQSQLDRVLQRETALFRSLEIMHHEGIFGQRPRADEYGYAPALPLATRHISSEILEAKWARLHGLQLAENET